MLAGLIRAHASYSHFDIDVDEVVGKARTFLCSSINKHFSNGAHNYELARLKEYQSVGCSIG